MRMTSAAAYRMSPGCTRLDSSTTSPMTIEPASGAERGAEAAERDRREHQQQERAARCSSDVALK